MGRDNGLFENASVSRDVFGGVRGGLCNTAGDGACKNLAKRLQVAGAGKVEEVQVHT